MQGLEKLDHIRSQFARENELNLKRTGLSRSTGPAAKVEVTDANAEQLFVDETGKKLGVATRLDIGVGYTQNAPRLQPLKSTLDAQTTSNEVVGQAFAHLIGNPSASVEVQHGPGHLNLIFSVAPRRVVNAGSVDAA